jgi:hemerythrin-like domain-containing protein
MKPIEILMNEHRLIEQVLNCLEVIATNADREGKTDLVSARQAIDFLRTFADHCHHGKEEDRLFPEMERKGFPRDGGPTGVMISEHQQGRSYIGFMLDAVAAEEKGDKGAAKWFVQNARGYIHLLRNHIYKEDHCLFPMADQSLNPDEQGALLAAFEEFDRKEMAPGSHERCLREADELADRFDVNKTLAGSIGV